MELYEYTAEWLKELKQLREQTRWIPVDEKLPKNDEGVLICTPHGIIGIAYYYIDDNYDPTHFYGTGWWDAEGEPIFEPIAWMPLPKPYKAESEE